MINPPKKIGIEYKAGERKMELGYIYKITNKINGKCYIGATMDFKRRVRDYKSVGNDSPIHRAMNEYGYENFTFENLERFPREHLEKREITWIAAYNTFAGEGYNMTAGGIGGVGYKHTDETKAKLSKLAKENQVWLDRKHTEEAKKKISEAKKGNKHSLGIKRSEETKEKMRQSQKKRRARERANRQKGNPQS